MPNVSIAAVRGALREGDRGAEDSFAVQVKDGITQHVSQDLRSLRNKRYRDYLEESK